MPQVSIVIPMYNEERYIARCLDSLITQTMKDFEIILIDDGSTDKSIAIASAYTDRLSLTILEQQHGGPGRARNWGASIAKGDILVFVDADMAFEDTYIEKLIAPILSGQETGTAHGWEYIANKHNPIARAYGMIRVSYDPKNQRSGVFRAIRKDLFLAQSGYNDDRYAFEDNIGEKIGPALYVPEAICYHNNPETLSEIFGHEKWIGESLIAKGMLRPYIMKYKWYLILFVCFCLGVVRQLSVMGVAWSHIIGACVLVLVSIVLAIGVRRALKEKYLSHLLFVPIVMITRGLGYTTGIMHHLFTSHSHSGK